jgi:hypothetical protein
MCSSVGSYSASRWAANSKVLPRELPDSLRQRMSDELADAVVEEWHLQAARRHLRRESRRYWTEAIKWAAEWFPHEPRTN